VILRPSSAPMDVLSPSSVGPEALADGNCRTIFASKGVTTLGISAGEYMVVDKMEEDSGTTVVTVVRSVAAADAVAAYYDCRDEVAATRHMDGADTMEISDDITDAYEAALASDDWHLAPLALDNRQLGRLTAGGHAYQPQQKNASRFEASTQPEPEIRGALAPFAISLDSFTSTLGELMSVLPTSAAIGRIGSADAHDLIELASHLFDHRQSQPGLLSESHMRSAALVAAAKLSMWIEELDPSASKRMLVVAKGLASPVATSTLAVALEKSCMPPPASRSLASCAGSTAPPSRVQLAVMPFRRNTAGRSAAPAAVALGSRPAAPAVVAPSVPNGLQPLPSVRMLWSLASLQEAWDKFLPLGAEFCFTVADLQRQRVILQSPQLMLNLLARVFQQAKERGSPEALALRGALGSQDADGLLVILSEIVEDVSAAALPGMPPGGNAHTSYLSRLGRSTIWARRRSCSSAKPPAKTSGRLVGPTCWSSGSSYFVSAQRRIPIPRRVCFGSCCPVSRRTTLLGRSFASSTTPATRSQRRLQVNSSP